MAELQPESHIKHSVVKPSANPSCLRAAGGDRRNIQDYRGGQGAIHPLSSMTE